MSGLIPEEKITEIKNAADIVSVIGESVTLKRAGQNYVGLCPFHNEKTGSFSVSPAKQMFYCFGCGVGGNVIKFLMLKDGLSFPEAARNLAKRYGVILDFDPKTRELLGKKERLYKANQIAQEFYAKNLWQNVGRQGLLYLQDRGVTEETIRKFGLGLSANDWDGLLAYLRQNGVKPEDALKAGLVIPRKSGGGYYDRFRNRLMFPIYDESGRIIGFGGRVMRGDEQPKYLNSPETDIYSKSKSLYGLNASKAACLQSGEVFIVEGYMDAIMLFQHGVQNVAATLGTAMTPEHVRLLKRYAKRKITLVYDSDEAGIRSACRCVDIFLQEHVDFSKNDVFTEENADTHILILPKGYDPDAFVREQGAKAFISAAGSAHGVVSFLLEEAVKKHGEAVEGKVKVVHELMPVLAVINDKVAQSLYIKHVAERLNLKEDLIRAELRSAFTRQKGRVDLTAPEQTRYAPQIVNAKNSRYEMKIAGLCLQYPEYVDTMLQTGLTAEYFKGETLRALMRAFWEYDERTQVQKFIEELESDDLRKLAYHLCMQSEVCELNAAVALTRTFVERAEKTRSRASLAQIKAAAVNDDDNLLQKLLREKQKAAQEAQKSKRSLLNKKSNSNS